MATEITLKVILEKNEEIILLNDWGEKSITIYLSEYNTPNVEAKVMFKSVHPVEILNYEIKK